MRLKLIACKIFYRELCAVVARSIHQVDIEFLPKGLHDIGWMVENPKASMYIWAKIPEFYSNLGSIEFTKRLLDEAKINQVEDEIEKLVNECVEFADASPFPDTATLFDNLYYEPEAK